MLKSRRDVTALRTTSRGLRNCATRRIKSASGLNLVVAAIVLWNTVCVARAVQALKNQGQPIDDSLLQHFSRAACGAVRSPEQ